MRDRMPLEVPTERFCGRTYSVWNPVLEIPATHGLSGTRLAVLLALFVVPVAIPFVVMSRVGITEQLIHWAAVTVMAVLGLSFAALGLTVRVLCRRLRRKPEPLARPDGVPSDAVVVSVRVSGASKLLGMDVGWLWQEDGWLQFTGLRSGFRLRRTDFKGSRPLLGAWHRSRWARAVVECRTGWVKTEKGQPGLGIRVRHVVATADGEWVVPISDQSRLVEMLAAWHEAPEADGEPIYPPVRHGANVTSSSESVLALIPAALVAGLFVQVVLWLMPPDLTFHGWAGRWLPVITVGVISLILVLLKLALSLQQWGYDTALRRFEGKWHARHLE
jgi:hypothetical protein